VSQAGNGIGSAAIAEIRAIEKVTTGAIATNFMRFGERVRMEMLDAAGRSIFGAIDQRVARSS
jgi:fumarylacetoacetate (FAA) hydrolase